MSHRANVRFYAELIDFLSPEHRSGRTESRFDVAGSIKDMIEAHGVPHTEVDLIIANGQSVDFSYRVQDGDQISVFPVFESLDITPIVKVRPEPLRQLRFVADDHLRRLARFLRLIGMDTLYDRAWDDADLVAVSIEQHRVLLTRDIELLKHGSLTHGYFVRSTDPREQVAEVVKRFQIEPRPFTRCMVCNGEIHPVTKDAVIDLVPPITKEHVHEYRQCTDCGKIYWRGSHYPELLALVEVAKEAGIRSRKPSRGEG